MDDKWQELWSQILCSCGRAMIDSVCDHCSTTPFPPVLDLGPHIQPRQPPDTLPVSLSDNISTDAASQESWDAILATVPVDEPRSDAVNGSPVLGQQRLVSQGPIGAHLSSSSSVPSSFPVAGPPTGFSTPDALTPLSSQSIQDSLSKCIVISHFSLRLKFEIICLPFIVACPECSKSFKKRSTLNSHLASHADEKRK